jgi:hypothetical protein
MMLFLLRKRLGGRILRKMDAMRRCRKDVFSFGPCNLCGSETKQWVGGHSNARGSLIQGLGGR